MSREKIAVVGLGLLGRGIAACFLSRGFDVIGFTPTTIEHEQAHREIAGMLQELPEDASVNGVAVHGWEARFHPVTTFESMRDCTFVVESVPENLETKTSVLHALEEILEPSVVIGSNTSAIPISVLQQTRQHPQRMVGMHWAQPAHRTRFLELIRGEQTSPEAFETTLQMGWRLGKEPIACQKDVPGFIVNRIAYAMYREACNLIETGVADAESIDNSLRNSLGLWASICGPLRWIDISGGPSLYARAMERVLPTLSNSTEVPIVLRKLAEQDAKGSENGRGFYSYTPEQAKEWQERFRNHVIAITAIHDREFPLVPDYS